MRNDRMIWVLTVLICALLFAMAPDSRPAGEDRTAAVAVAQDASPSAGFDICPGFPYTVTLLPLGPDDQLGMFEALSGRVNQLQNEERIVWAIAPLIRGDDGTFTVDLRLIADTEPIVEAILATPAVLHIVEEIDLDVGVGTSIPGTPQLTPIVDNSGLDDAYVTDVADQPVLRLVLKGSSVNMLATVVAEAPAGEQALAIILDQRLMEAHAIDAPVPTAVDITIREQILPEAAADTLAVALRAGPLPGPLEVMFMLRSPEDSCLG